LTIYIDLTKLTFFGIDLERYMHPAFYIFISIFIGYAISVWWAHRYWSNFMNTNSIELCPEEAHIIIPMLLLWFFYWDGIGVIMRNANRVTDEKKTNLERVCV